MFTPELPGAQSIFWRFKEGIVFLNHGSFGACPLPVQKRRESLLRLIEFDPMGFLVSDYQPLLADVLEKLTEFTGAQPGSLVLVENTTTGINTILKNLPLNPGDEILVTDQEYFSSINSLRVIAGIRGASVRLIHLPFPIESENDVLTAVEDAVTPSTRFALIDHIVSTTGMILPLKKIIELLSDKGVHTVVDGAHGPGQVTLDLKKLGCLAYVGNCHKWLCSPRSSAILYVRPDFQQEFFPLAISHVPSDFDTDLSSFQIYFRWNGTPDPTPALCIPDSLRFMEKLHSKGWSGIMSSNRELALAARQTICSTLGVDPPCPDSMVGSMAAIPLLGYSPCISRVPGEMDPLQNWLRREKGIVVPVTAVSNDAQRSVRISAQQYNFPEQYHYLAESLVEFREYKYKHVVSKRK